MHTFERLTLLSCLAVLLVAFLVSNAHSARKRSNFTGTIRDSVYTDSETGFSVKISPWWLYERGKVGDLCHLHLQENNKQLKELNKELGTNTQPNLMEFWIVNSPATPAECLDSILSDSSKSDLRKAFLERLNINLASSMSEGIEDFRRKDTTIADKPASYWRGFRNRKFRMGSIEDHFKDHLRVIAVDCEDRLLVCLSRNLESDFWIAGAIDSTLLSLRFAEPSPEFSE